MALVKSWDELKQREAIDPSATISIQAAHVISKIAREMVEGSEQLPADAEAKILDAIATAGSGAFQRAYERALAGAMRVIIDLVADYEAERRRQEVIERLKAKVQPGTGTAQLAEPADPDDAPRPVPPPRASGT